MYFDIDSKNYIDLNKIKKIIWKYFPGEKLAISGSVEEIKYSYHIVLPDVIIRNNDELVKIRYFVKNLSETEYPYFDWRVYSERRLMKCVGFNKEGRKEQKIIEDNDIKRHLINSFVDENAKNILFFFPDKT